MEIWPIMNHPDGKSIYSGHLKTNGNTEN